VGRTAAARLGGRQIGGAPDRRQREADGALAARREDAVEAELQGQVAAGKGAIDL